MPDPVTVPPVNDPAVIRDLLALRNIAVVGLSDNPARTSYSVSRYMQSQGYRILPVNPVIVEALGELAYPTLTGIHEPLELVNIFRRSEHVGAIVDEAIACSARGIWMQVGVIDAAAAERARAAGIPVVMDRCLMVEHGRNA